MIAENDMTHQIVNFTRDTLILPVDILMYKYQLSLLPQLLAQFTITTEYTNIYAVSKNNCEVLGGAVFKDTKDITLNDLPLHSCIKTVSQAATRGLHNALLYCPIHQFNILLSFNVCGHLVMFISQEEAYCFIVSWA
jgi:hypothetical protein